MTCAISPLAVAVQGLVGLEPLLVATQGLLCLEADGPPADPVVPGAQGRITPRRKTRRLWPLPVVDLEEDDLAALRATGLLKL